MKKAFELTQLKGRLVVSCQALDDEPLHGSFIMARMALAAQMGGAAGIRANTAEDIMAIHELVNLPVIGIVKRDFADSPVYITPTMREVRELLGTPAEIIAMDATGRPRPDGADTAEMVREIHSTGRLVMADISSEQEGLRAARVGFDLVSTTLSGYTPYTRRRPRPDLELVKALSRRLSIPVVAEGNIKNPAELARALDAGAYFAVVGGSITRPQLITRDFVDAVASRPAAGRQ